MDNRILFFCLSLYIIEVLSKDLRIVGGENALYTEFPYLASFRVAYSGTTICAGSIITATHILTAAHCIYGLLDNLNYVTIYTGLSIVHDIDEPYYSIKKTSIHPDFEGKMAGRYGRHNDIAIATVYGPMEFNQHQNKIDLPTRPVQVGDRVVLSGWGLTSYPGQHASELQSTTVEVVNRLRCQQSFNFEVLTDQICSHAIEKGACIGDSGGPVVKDNTLVGIISYSVPCATEAPDIHTDVFQHLHYIHSVIYHD